MTREYLTKAGREQIEGELRKLLSEERPRIIRALAAARAHGDLKENAEFHSAREKQGMIEARISYLKSVVARSEVVDVASQSGTVKFGATVQLEDDDTGEEVTYQLVGEAESDLRRGKLNWRTAFAAALIGKDVGDMVCVKAPAGERFFTVIDIRYIA
ncbi:MAG: transcription elongation factor GreA [Rhodobacteraceae bacterium]|nr:transcription elongation factor GreA [Paracoccaceae bacterium]